RLRVAGDEVGPQRLSEALEVLTIHTVFKPREGRRTCQVLLGSQWRTLDPQLKQRILPQAVGIIAVGISRRPFDRYVGPRGLAGDDQCRRDDVYRVWRPPGVR